VATADVQLGEDDAVLGADVGHGGDHPMYGLAVQCRVGDLRADVAVQPDQVEDRVRQHALYRVGGVVLGEGEPELLVADAGGNRAVSVDVDVRGHPDEHRLALTGQSRQVGDLDAGIQHDAPNPDTDRVAELLGRFRVAVHDDAGGLHAAGQGDGQLTGRADVDAEPFFACPARHRRGQQ
jgi:hypothetical protein